MSLIISFTACAGTIGVGCLQYGSTAGYGFPHLLPIEDLREYGFRTVYDLSNKEHIKDIYTIKESLVMMKLSVDNLEIKNMKLIDAVERHEKFFDWYADLPVYVRARNRTLFYEFVDFLAEGKPMSVEEMKSQMILM